MPGKISNDVVMNDAPDAALIPLVDLSEASPANQNKAIEVQALRDRSFHTGTQAISTVTGLEAALASAGIAGDGVNFIVVPLGADAEENGTALLAAYAAACDLTPNGAALSATNRAAVILPPGVYDLGTSELVLDTEFVDVIGLTTDRSQQRVTSNVGAEYSAVLRQAANDVRVSNIEFFNSNITADINFDTSDPAVYRPDGDYPDCILRNCAFLCDFDWYGFSKGVMGTPYAYTTSIEYSGTYIDCVGTYCLFGGAVVCSGYFERCKTQWITTEGVAVSITDRNGTPRTISTADGQGFGSEKPCTASGIFIDCEAVKWSFGYKNASGTFINCTGGLACFSTVSTGSASGQFINCTGGDGSFGAYNASGTFTRCTAGSNSFGSYSSFTGKAYYCRLTSGSFPTVSSGGITRYCINGDDTTDNQG